MKIAALMKKEFYRFFHDPRLIITILLPGLAIFFIYNLIGAFINTEERYDFRVCIAGESALVEVLESAVTESGSAVEWTKCTAEEGKAALENGEADACLVFSEAFDETLLGGSVELWYDDAVGASSAFSSLAYSVLQGSAMRFSVSLHSLTDGRDVGKAIMANMLPLLVVIFIFSACMSVTLESMAGEKERGTLATILATSVKRSHIALGKVVPLSCIAAIGAASSFLGVILSLPKLMGVGWGTLFAGGFGFGSYLLIFLLILSFVPLIVSAIAAVSTLARTVKEASGYTGAIMLVVMVLSFVSVAAADLGNWVVAVPVLNAVIAMGKILGGELFLWQALVSVGFNAGYTVLLVLLIARMLSSERIMFGK